MLSSSPQRLPVHLPKPRTKLVGREQDIERVVALLRQDETTLLTLTGPGGTGKTRLAIAAGARVSDAYPDGIWFIALAPVSDPAFVIPTIAMTMQIVEQSGELMVDQMRAVIGEQRILLIVDNVEHVIEAAADIGALSDGCLNLTVLATSRASLRLYGEREYPVSPLTLPVSDRPVGLAGSETCEAIELFTERVRDIHPDFELTGANIQVVADICRQLDGLPLAIELAAARTRHLPLTTMRERLEHGLDLLRNDARDIPTRQRTLRNTIAWSYDLLSPDEQQALRCLSVFRGGWTREAAGRVIDAVNVDDVLDRLIEHNLIRMQPETGGEARYLMLETIREYALEQLEATGQGENIRQRHAAYFTELVDEAERNMRGSAEVEWLHILDREYDNLRTAMAWLHERRATKQGLLMTGKLSAFWFNRRSLSEGRTHIQAFLDLPDAIAPAEERARALMGLAWLASFQGDHASGVRAADEATAIVRALGNRVLEPQALLALGIAEAMSGNIDHAIATFKEVTVLAREVDDKPSLSRALNNLGIVADDDIALGLLEEALRVARESGAPDTIALALENLAANTTRIAGANEQTRAMARESLQIYQHLNSNWGISMALDRCAHDAMTSGDPHRAARLAGAAATLRERIGLSIQPIVVAAHEQLMATLRSALKDEFESAWTAGAAMSVEESVQLALGLHDAPDPVAGPDTTLSKREVDVLKLLVDGRSNREIADALFISPHTAAHHVTSILNKLGLDSRTAAATWAVKQGIV